MIPYFRIFYRFILFLFSFSNILKYIRFEVKELSKYKDITYIKEFCSPSVNIDGIDFSIKIEIKKFYESNKDDNYFGVYLCIDQDPKIQYVIILLFFIQSLDNLLFFYFLSEFNICLSDLELYILNRHELNQSYSSSKDIFHFFYTVNIIINIIYIYIFRILQYSQN